MSNPAEAFIVYLIMVPIACTMIGACAYALYDVFRP